MAPKRKLRPSEPEPIAPKEEGPEEEEESEEEEEESNEEDQEESEADEEEEQSDGEEVGEEEDSDDGEEEEDLSDRETLRKLLEPFSKDQLIDLLKHAASRNPSLLNSISYSAESDPIHRKIFVHGLSWDATTASLSTAFSPFGDIEDCKVVADRLTGRSKGYGFVLFRSRSSALKALKQPNKLIGGRPTSCQLAAAGAHRQHATDASGRKVFVSSIGSNVNLDRLKEFFGRFGEIEEGPLGVDKATGKHRGFAIFVYKSAEGCRKALEEPVKAFEGCVLQCKMAVEEPKPKNVQAQVAGPATLAQAQVAGPPVTSAQLPAWQQGSNVGLGLLNSVVAGNRNVSPAAAAAYGVNTVSPSVIGSYQSLDALQGLGAYPGMGSQSSLGASGSGLPPYFGR